jgi:hypothetical protein
MGVFSFVMSAYIPTYTLGVGILFNMLFVWGLLAGLGYATVVILTTSVGAWCVRYFI